MIGITVTSCVLICTVLAVRFLARGRISRRLQYGLWLLVALRLLVPIAPCAPLSVLNAVDTTKAEQFILGQPVTLTGNAPTELTITESTQPQTAPRRANAIKLVWYGGMAAAGLWFAGVNAVFYARLRKSRKPIKADDCPLPVYVSDAIASPCLFGLFRSAVYLTPDVSNDERKARHVIAHEVCHYSQGDHIWSAVRCVCLMVHWFNPLVWAAAVYSRFDCELACDELAVKRLGNGEKIAYGRTLLSLISQKPSPNMLACTATTMASGGRRLKRRIGLIAASPKTMAAALVLLVAVLCLAVGCTFTGASKPPMSASVAAEQLAKSIVYENGEITFTLPADYREPTDWNIFVYGRAPMGEEGMSVHLFEQENADQSWRAGATYAIDLAPPGYLELQMDIYLRSDATIEHSIDLLKLAGIAPIDEPHTGYNEFILTGLQTKAGFILPDGWSLGEPGEDTSGSIHGTFEPVVTIWNGSQRVAAIGFHAFTLYEGGDVPPGDFYKTVYPDLRLSSMAYWEPYTALKTTKTGETGIVTVGYMDSDEIDKHPGAMANVPIVEVPGILCYDTDLLVYVGIEFAESSGVTDAQVLAIANSLTLAAAA